MIEVKLLASNADVLLLESEELKENLSFTFELKNITRAALQEVARHRAFSLSVKSSRYTLSKDLKDEETFTSLEKDKERVEKYIKLTGNEDVDQASFQALYNLKGLVEKGISNDILKYAMPESYKVDLVISSNFAGLYNFLILRSSSHALKELQEIAKEIKSKIPSKVQHYFEEINFNV